jgi:phenylalanyl-tRNA synthetase alpha chain
MTEFKIFFLFFYFALNSNLWKEKKFKEYNLDSLGTIPDSGHLHPLQKVRTEIRKIFIEMG